MSKGGKKASWTVELYCTHGPTCMQSWFNWEIAPSNPIKWESYLTVERGFMGCPQLVQAFISDRGNCFLYYIPQEDIPMELRRDWKGNQKAIKSEVLMAHLVSHSLRCGKSFHFSVCPESKRPLNLNAESVARTRTTNTITSRWTGAWKFSN